MFLLYITRWWLFWFVRFCYIVIVVVYWLFGSSLGLLVCCGVVYYGFVGCDLCLGGVDWWLVVGCLRCDCVLLLVGCLVSCSIVGL